MSQLAEGYVEVLGSSTPQVLNAHEYAEILALTPTPQARNANEYAEILAPTPTPAARAGNTYVDVLVVRPPDLAPFIGWGIPL